MKKSVSVFVLMMLVIAMLIVTACYGISAIGLKSVFDDDAIRMGLDLVGGSSITLEAVAEEGAEITEETLDAVVAVLNQRVTNANYTEATVTKISDKNRVRVEIPSIADPEEAIDLVGTTAKLSFVDSDGNVVVEGSQVKGASVQTQQDPMTGAVQTVVALQFDQSAVESFANATERMASLASSGKNYISIMLDDDVISSPSVSERINSSECIISGNFTGEEASNLANLISSGNLPCELSVAETRSVGASLGEEALSQALKAGVIGILLVMLFMIIMYQLPGVVSAIALIAYIALTIVCIIGFRINLSLPGIAGIFLTIGMAVDANVIIFERIREELNAGKSVKAAVKSGFNRAFTAIIDSNVTTLIAAVVLWKFGTGAIQGFAITLLLGVIISLITSLFVTKILLGTLVGMGVTNIRLFGAKYADNN